MNAVDLEAYSRMANVQVIPRFRPLNRREKTGMFPLYQSDLKQRSDGANIHVLVLYFFLSLNSWMVYSVETGGSQVVVDFDTDHKGLTVWTEGGKKPNVFTFDHVFSPDSSQVRTTPSNTPRNSTTMRKQRFTSLG